MGPRATSLSSVHGWLRDADAHDTLHRPPSTLRAHRRRILATLCFAVALLGTPSSGAQGVAVPASVQAALVAKVLPYDRNFAVRAKGRVRIAVVLKPGNADSARFAAQIRAALSEIDAIGGLPHEDELVEFDNAATLADRCRVRGLSILYVGPGLGGDIESVRAALEGLSVARPQTAVAVGIAANQAHFAAINTAMAVARFA